MVSDGFPMVSRWFHAGFTLVSRGFHAGFTIAFMTERLCRDGLHLIFEARLETRSGAIFLKLEICDFVSKLPLGMIKVPNFS